MTYSGMTYSGMFQALKQEVVGICDDLAAWLSDNTEEVFEEQQAVDDIRASLLLDLDKAEHFRLPDGQPLLVISKIAILCESLNEQGRRLNTFMVGPYEECDVLARVSRRISSQLARFD